MIALALLAVGAAVFFALLFVVIRAAVKGGIEAAMRRDLLQHPNVGLFIPPPAHPTILRPPARPRGVL